MNIVLGSGPASVFCALALLERGAKVLMIDPGERLEDARQVIIDRAQGRSKDQWGQELFSLVRENTAPNVKGVPKKLVYGSDFPFRWLEPDVSLEQNGVDTLASHAAGGLSNAWGANILPLLPQDTGAWPFLISDLKPYYEKVAQRIPVAAEDDSLSQIFPIYGSPTRLPQSKQSKALIEDALRHSAQLQKNRMYIGRSRLAVQGDACVACGLCLYGCPHRLIYSSAQSLALLQSYSNFTYQRGWVAKALRDDGDGARVTIQHLTTKEFEQVRGERVFVGCGAVGTTALMLRSMGIYDEEISLQDSQYFLTPFLRFSRSGDVLREELHTLSQVALEILDPALCDKSVHVLFYTYNDMYTRALTNMLGPFAKIAKPFLKEILGRLIIMQGYLHSDYSARVGVRLERKKGGDERVLLSAHLNDKTRDLVKDIHKRMSSMWSVFRGLPVTFMSHIGDPGKSYHLGGSFPMARSPGRYQSDIMGRPSGFTRVHIIDSSIFTDVPATNSTFTAMANAYRIGTEAV